MPRRRRGKRREHIPNRIWFLRAFCVHLAISLVCTPMFIWLFLTCMDENSSSPYVKAVGTLTFAAYPVVFGASWLRISLPIFGSLYWCLGWLPFNSVCVALALTAGRALFVTWQNRKRIDLPWKICPSVLIALLLFGMPKPSLAEASNRPKIVPAIAHIGSIQVGVTTMERLEQMFGKGLPITGGHPQGAREWISKQTGWVIFADGFDYCPTGRIVESFEVASDTAGQGRSSFDDQDASIPHGSIRRANLSLMDAIVPGMSRQAVKRVLIKKHIKVTMKRDSLMCRETGHIRVDQNIVYSNWLARFSFEGGKLEDVRIDIE